MSAELVNVTMSVIAIVVSLVAYRATVYQNRLSASSVAADWLRDLREWASEAVNVLADAGDACVGDADEGDVRVSDSLSCRTRLSALIDRGRFLLPNERDTEYGSHKPRAYRGLRHQALDALVAAEQILGKTIPLAPFPDQRAALVGVRREFVSIVQAIIDPQSFNHDIARILRLASDKRVNDPTMGGLLPDAKMVPAGATGIMEIAGKRYQHAEPASGKRAKNGEAAAQLRR